MVSTQVTINTVRLPKEPYSLPPPAAPIRAHLNEGTGAQLPSWRIGLNTFRHSISGGSALYPSPFLRAELQGELANYATLPASHVSLFPGSDSLLKTVAIAVRDRCLPTQHDPTGSPKWLVIGPTYSQASTTAALYGNEVFELRGATPKFDYALQDVEKAIQATTPSLVYLCNPNNPTGRIVDPKEISTLCERHPKITFLVDEAYVEFDGTSSARLIPSAPNLIISRTLSKAFGLANVRVGYGLAQPSILQALAQYTNDKDLSDVSLITALTCLRHRGYVTNHVTAARQARQTACEVLTQHGFEPLSGGGNFVAFHVPAARSEQFVEWAALYGLQLRNLSHLSPGLIRLTVGDEEVMEAFRRIFPRFPDQKRDAECAWLDWDFRRRDSLQVPGEMGLYLSWGNHLWNRWLERRQADAGYSGQESQSV